MTPRRALLLPLVALLLLVWWWSGLDRAPASAEDFFSRAEIAGAEAYRGPLYLAAAGRVAFDLGLLSVLAFTGAGSWLARLRGPRWIRGAVLAASGVVVLRLLVALPLSFWAGYVHEHAWGFSTQTVGGWLGDRGRSAAVSVAVAIPAYVGVVWAVRRWPRRWPALVAPAAAAAILLGSFAWPLLVEPLFNRFRPMEGPAAARLEALADRAGVPVEEVLVADASRRTRKVNAYVSGLGATRRLVVYDTLLRSASPEEVEAVVAHELGHRREGHVLRGTLAAAGAGAAGVLLVGLAAGSAAVRRATGARGPADPRMLPALLLLLAVLQLASLPVANRLSRGFERRADRHAAALAPEGFEAMQRRLAVRNLSHPDPGPVAYRFLFTHPTAAERLAYAP